MTVLPKHRLNSNRLHGAIFQEIGRPLPSSIFAFPPFHLQWNGASCSADQGARLFHIFAFTLSSNFLLISQDCIMFSPHAGEPNVILVRFPLHTWKSFCVCQLSNENQLPLFSSISLTLHGVISVPVQNLRLQNIRQKRMTPSLGLLLVIVLNSSAYIVPCRNYGGTQQPRRAVLLDT